MQTQERNHHKERVRRLSLILPVAISDEICEQPTGVKAMLLAEQVDAVLDQLDTYPEIDLSTSSTQWIESLTLNQRLQFCENLALMIMNEVSQ